jgi:hypothetical protein
MPAYTFKLLFTPGNHFVSLRELNGYDELMIEDAGTSGIISLLNRLMVEDAVGKLPSAAKLAIADRDYVLAEIYKYTYGSRIQSVLTCQSCTQPFDLDFLLDDLVAHTRGETLACTIDDHGFYITEDQDRFRLPNGEDELATYGLKADQAEQLLLCRCLPEPVTKEKADRIQALMERLAPILNMNMQVTCPECRHIQEAHFDIQSFLLAQLKNERKQAAAEVHCLAATYHWSHQEIIELPRSLRKMYVSLIGMQ